MCQAKSKHNKRIRMSYISTSTLSEKTLRQEAQKNAWAGILSPPPKKKKPAMSKVSHSNALEREAAITDLTCGAFKGKVSRINWGKGDNKIKMEKMLLLWRSLKNEEVSTGECISLNQFCLRNQIPSSTFSRLLQEGGRI